MITCLEEVDYGKHLVHCQVSLKKLPSLVLQVARNKTALVITPNHSADPALELDFYCKQNPRSRTSLNPFLVANNVSTSIEAIASKWHHKIIEADSTWKMEQGTEVIGYQNGKLWAG